MISITRSYEISAGHHLPLHEGKCRTPHGHNYIIEVSVQGYLQSEGPSTGMVMDFSDLDKEVWDYLKMIDHQNLNEIKMEGHLKANGKRYPALPMPPTAENICSWLFSCLQESFPIYSASRPNEQQLNKVRVYETRNSYVELTR